MSSSIAPLRERIVAAAEGYLGISEATGKNDGKPSELFTFGEHKPWCAGMVARIFKDCGAELPGKPWLLPSVEYMEGMMRASNRHLAWKDYARVLPGDIIFFSWRVGSDRALGGRHCGIVTSVDGAHVHTIEGNVGDAVRRKRHAVTSATITGRAGLE